MSSKEPAIDQTDIVLFGASGLLGGALHRSLAGTPGPDARVTTIPWTTASSEGFAKTLGRLAGDRSATFVFANGLTDPRLPVAEIRFSNLEFIQRVVEATRANPGIRYLTIGSIMENFPAACRANPYLESKLELGSWIRQLAQAPGLTGRALHVRLHTVYGGTPKPHMFLGQMARAIQGGTVFRMSSGTQLREYHHADDVALSLRALLAREWDFGPVVEISSGEPLALAELARGVFRAFDREALLQVGAIQAAQGENTNRAFERSPPWMLPRTREPVQGVVESLRASWGSPSR